MGRPISFLSWTFFYHSIYRELTKRLNRDASGLKPKSCPNCGPARIAEILYGMPVFAPRLQRQLDAGDVVLGGCYIGENDPKWQCLDCEQTIRSDGRINA
jgi:hypothetical protein